MSEQRKILFRGKTKRYPESFWVYGGVVHQTDFYGDPADKWFIIDGTETHDYDIGPEYEVISETVGQYTGLKDKNERRIFESDIVTLDGEDGYFLVIWDDDTARFSMNGYSLSVDFDNFYPWEVEVAGNKYENPEMLEWDS